MSRCEWCDYKDNEWLLHRSLHWSVYLADVQDYVGRCILVLNRHCGSLSELNITEWIELKTIVDRLEFVYTDPQVFLNTVNLNLRSVFMGSQAAVKHMAKQGSGSIVNISSVGGLVPDISQISYGTSKAAINYASN